MEALENQAAGGTTGADHAGRQSGGLLSTVLLFTPLISSTILTKVAFYPVSDVIPISVPLIIGCVFVGLFTNRMRFVKARLFWFLILMAWLWSIQIYSEDAFSITSIGLMCALYLTFTVQLRQTHFDLERALQFFQTLVLWICVAGIAQFFLQFVIGQTLAFPIEHFLPDKLLVQGFHYLNSLKYGSATLKANGVFLIEPSQFSQFLALAIIAELTTYNRRPRLALYLFGMVVSYSGTGFVILLASLPLVVVGHKRWELMALGLVFLILLAPFAGLLHLDILLGRVTEFGSTESSGYMRFIGGFYDFNDWLWPRENRTLFGYGAGAFADLSKNFFYPAADLPINKLLIEYGMLGAIPFFFYLVASLNSGPELRIFRFALTVSFFLNGLYVPLGQGIALSLLLWIPQMSRVADSSSESRAGGSTLSTAS